MREQHNRDVESLNREREEFMKKMVHEHSEWFSKIQHERADLLLGLETQKKEMEDCIQQKRDELEYSIRDREEAFEHEKKIELQRISTLKESVQKDLEYVAAEMKRLKQERLEIKLDRERREREWVEINRSIEELKVQRQKLKEQRELLQTDREEILRNIEELKKLGDLKIALDNMTVAQMRHSLLESSWEKISKTRLNSQVTVQKDDCQMDPNILANGYGTPVPRANGAPLSGNSRFSWIRRCSELIFRSPSEKYMVDQEGRNLTSEHKDACLTQAGKLASNGCNGQRSTAGRDMSKELNGGQRMAVEACSQVRAGREKLSSHSVEMHQVAGKKRRLDCSPGESLGRLRR